MDPILQKPAINEHLGIFLFALFASLITLFIAWYKSYFKFPQRDPKPILIHVGHLIGVFAIYFLVALLCSVAAYKILGGLSGETKQQLSLEIDAVRAWINIIAMAFVLIGLLIYLKCLKKEIWVTVIGEGVHRLKNFGMGIVSWLISFPLVVATSQLTSILLILLSWQSSEQVSVRFYKSTMQNPVVYIITTLFVVFFIPLIEEIIFRGFVQNWLMKFFGKTTAIFLGALIFSFFHYSPAQGYGNIEIITSLFVLSCFLGFIYERQKSIYASWGLHATFNGVNVLFMSLATGVQ